MNEPRKKTDEEITQEAGEEHEAFLESQEIKPSGTVRQGRRPMYKPFEDDDEDDTCPKCGSSVCTHIWELGNAKGTQ